MTFTDATFWVAPPKQAAPRLALTVPRLRRDLEPAANLNRFLFRIGVSVKHGILSQPESGISADRRSYLSRFLGEIPFLTNC